MRIARIITFLLIALIPAGVVFFGVNIAMQFAQSYGEMLHCGTEVREVACEYKPPIDFPNWLPSVASLVAYFGGFFSMYLRPKEKKESC